MDVQKSYDTVEWDALERIMQEMSFPEKFVKWIMTCTRTVSYKYTVNGQISRTLKAKRGLRQGDPISPLLFILVMEYLHRCMGKLHDTSEYRFHPKCARLKITNICFANDLLLFSRGDGTSIKSMMKVSNKFSDSTGLKANPQKCQVYFSGTRDNDKQEILAATGFEEGQLLFKYLSVPLPSRKLSIVQCQPLIDKIMARINHWTAKIMFLWSENIEGSRKAPVAWDRICDPKKAGGLNIISLKEWNATTMIKLLWNVQAKKDKLWVKWLNAYYIKGLDVQEWQIPHDCSWIIKEIMKSRALIIKDPKWRTKLSDENFITRDSYELLRETQPLLCYLNLGGDSDLDGLLPEARKVEYCEGLDHSRDTEKWLKAQYCEDCCGRGILYAVET
ncbi:uncharacterized protein LOC131658460 [Vicia villosa]|uniref:uncharacterized protein LOC131658460 n=1 Tax=Vicia villosa TaxID=3911 RepID=UPI00273C4A51|nr:uncharacterized protein LOC131658460 [Vicia villosa]